MGIGNPIFFLFSLFIAAVILMYFFRKQYRDQVVPSNLLWEEVMKEWQASSWFHRLQKNLLLLLQVLILFFLMIALVKPYTLNEMAQEGHLVILLDTSASMNAVVNNRSHFEEAKEDIQSLIERSDGKVTLLGVGESVTTIVTEETNDRVVLNGLKNLPLSNDNEDMKKAIHLGEALAIGSESIIHIFSDSMEKEDFTEELTSPIQVHNLLTNPVNVSLTSFGVERLGSSYKGVAVIENQSEVSRRGHLSIYDEKKKISSVELTLDPGKETVVPLIDLSHSPIYKAVIDFKDDYMEDNSLSSIQAASKPAIHVIGEINPFLLKGFHSIGVDVKTIEEDQMKSGDELILTTKEKWQRLSVESPAMIVPTRSKESTPLTHGIKATNEDPLLKHVDLEKVYVEKVNSIQIKNLQSVATGDSTPLIQKGEVNGQKLALAKEAAARTVSLLRDKDTLGVIAFDDRPWEIVETKPLSNRKKAEEQIRSISPGGGTEIFSSLQQAYKSLEDLPLKRKHIILLTDGQSATTGSYQSLVEDGHDKQITLSTVSIGEGADRGLLNDLSQWGKGRFYDVVDASVIPSILTRETVITTRTYIEDNPFYPAITSSEWGTLFTEGIPQMNAYIATTPKGNAQVEMKSEKNDPILASWRYGLGRTFAFTSDTTGKWTGDFIRWKGWPTFVNELVTRSFPDIQSNPYNIDVKDHRGNTQLKLSASEGDVSQLAVTALDESGKKIPATTRIKAPGDYEVEFESRLSPGLYHMNISKTGEDGGSSYQTGFSVPYSKEYYYKGGTRSLEEIVEATGGKMYSSTKEVFREFKTKSSREQSTRLLFIIIGFLLFFGEIFIRRFGLGPIMGVFNKLKRRISASVPKEQTSFEQLGRKVKQNRKPDEWAKSISSKSMPKVSEKKGLINKPKVKQEPQETRDDDRLQRLLEAKRRRDN